jgi:hypothetical protein
MIVFSRGDLSNRPKMYLKSVRQFIKIIRTTALLRRPAILDDQLRSR